MTKHVLMVATVPSMIGQFNMNNIRILMEMGYKVDVAADFNDISVWPIERINKFKGEMAQLGIECIQLDFSRSPLKLNRHVSSYKEVLKLLEKKKYNFIHTHTPIASAIVRLAAHKTGTKVIYTAHGFHFYDGAPLKNWIIFYPVEKWLSKYTDVLITINKEDYERAKKKLKAKKVEYVPGVGIDLEKFNSGLVNREAKRTELGLKPGERMLLSVGELSVRKNHQVVLDALAKLNDPSIHYFIAGKGDLGDELQKKAEEKKVNLHLLGYRTDVSALIQSADLFVFPSLQEGLPVALMEAIACKVPVVCSEIRGNTDLVSEHLFKPMDSDTLSREIRVVLDGKNEDVVEKNYKTLQDFDLLAVEDHMEKIYVGGVLHRLIIRYKIFKELGIDPSHRLVLSVGELNDNKNHETVIKALEGMRDVEYLIAGKGDKAEELKQLAQQCGVSLHLLGFRTDVVDLYKACDLYVLPSHREGLNVSLMEAMTCGAVCLCSDIRGNRDLIEDREFRADSHRIDEWREKIEMVIAGSGNREQCLEQVLLFGLPTVGEKMTEIYEKI